MSRIFISHDLEQAVEAIHAPVDFTRLSLLATQNNSWKKKTIFSLETITDVETFIQL